MARTRGKDGKNKSGTPGAGGPGKGTPSSSASSLLKLQKSAGNSAVSRLLKSGLAVGAPGDAHEQEAERMADRVTSSAPSPEELLSPGSPAAGTESPLSGLGPGRPLDPEARAVLEPRFGRDFGAVRVHDDPAAAEAAREVGARAFTVGQDLVFDRGQYAPETADGRRLLAHELTHVVQQSAAGGPPFLQRSPWDVKRPEASASQSAPPPIVEIGAAEPISSEDPRLFEFAQAVMRLLMFSRGSKVQVTAFWEKGGAEGAGGVEPAAAFQRAELAKAALVKLGVFSSLISTGIMASHVMSDPQASPGGSVRIALSSPESRQPAFLPGMPETVSPLPKIPSGMLKPGPRVQPTNPPSPLPSQSTKPPGLLDEEPKSRKGEAGDIPKAFMELSFIKKAIEEAKEQALAAWKNLPLGGKITVITGAVAIGAGIAAKPELRDKALEQAHGKEIPIPLPIPGKFSVQILNKKEPPQFDPHQPPSHQKLADPVGQGLMVKWKIEF